MGRRRAPALPGRGGHLPAPGAAPDSAGVAGGPGRDRGRAQGRLPRLISPEEIRGCFHVHSYYSDGVNSLEELIAAAKSRGWSFLGLSDHSQSAYYAGGLKTPDLERQRQEVEARRREHPDFTLFWGVESDILGDGSLDYPDEVLRI